MGSGHKSPPYSGCYLPRQQAQGLVALREGPQLAGDGRYQDRQRNRLAPVRWLRRVRTIWPRAFRNWPASGIPLAMAILPLSRCSPAATGWCGGFVKKDTNGRRRSSPGYPAAAVRFALTGRYTPLKTILLPSTPRSPASGIPRKTGVLPQRRFRRAPPGRYGGAVRRGTSGRLPWHLAPLVEAAALYAPGKRWWPGKMTWPVSFRPLLHSGIPKKTAILLHSRSRPVPTAKCGGVVRKVTNTWPQ